MRIISLGAGVQSTTMLLMALKGELGPRPDCAIFSDTQWEPPGVYEHLKWLLEEVKKYDFPIYTVTAGNLKEHILESIAGDRKRIAQPPFFTKSKKSKRGMLRRTCTSEYKIEPIQAKIRELVGLGKGQKGPGEVLVEQWMGISFDELMRMKQSKLSWIRNHYPLVDRRITRHACLKWMEEQGYPEPVKSACVACPYHSDQFWNDMKMHHPEEWEEAVQFDRDLREGFLPGVKQKAYVHSSLVPLERVALSNLDESKYDLFGEECEGLCGV